LAVILVVDDDKQIRTLVRAVLEQRGHQVLEASLAFEALYFLSREAIDLAVCDLGLPDLAGEEMIRWFRELQPRLPIVVVSGSLPASLMHRTDTAAELLADAALAKPFRHGQLAATVESLLPAVTAS
jgi:two-component system KDP operon response regulator KdpE